MPEEEAANAAERFENRMFVEAKRAKKKKTAFDNVRLEERRMTKAHRSARGDPIDSSSESIAGRGGNNDDNDEDNDDDDNMDDASSTSVLENMDYFYAPAMAGGEDDSLPPPPLGPPPPEAIHFFLTPLPASYFAESNRARPSTSTHSRVAASGPRAWPRPPGPVLRTRPHIARRAAPGRHKMGARKRSAPAPGARPRACQDRGPDWEPVSGPRRGDPRS